MLTNFAPYASIAVGLVLPAVVALLTRPSTDGSVKSGAHGALSALVGSLLAYVETTDYSFVTAAALSGISLLSGTVFYHGLLKKYPWFVRLQNTFVREAEALHTQPSGGDETKGI